MEYYRGVGADVAITEMEVATSMTEPGGDPVAAQAAVYADAANACRQGPNCTSFTVWGVADHYSWRGEGERPLLLDNTFAPKAVFGAVTSLLAPLPRIDHAKPRLSLHLARVKRGRRCSGMRASLRGEDTGLVNSVRYLVGRRALATRRAPRFQRTIRRSVLRAGKRVVIAQATLSDGRVVELRRRSKRC